MVNRRTLVASAAAMPITLAGLRSTGAKHASTIAIGSLEEPGSLSALVELPHHFPLDVPQTLLFDSLTQFMPDSSVAPKLATSWDISDDELTYTFSLDPAATFHDGTPLTAHDVVFTVEACLDPDSNASSEGLDTVESVTADDDHTVIFTLTQQTPAFLAQAGGRGIVPRHALEGKDIATDEFNRAPIGSGPYRFVSFTPGERVVLEAVSDHYRVTPSIERVEFRIVTDQNVLLTQLMSGELDYGLIAPRNLAVLDGAESIDIVEVPTPRFFSIIPNHAKPLWQDAAVRAAILGAIDREGIVNSILQGHGTVVDTNVTPASWAYSEEGITHHPYDPEASAIALDAAGYTVQSDGIRANGDTRIAFTTTMNAYDATLQQALLVAQQNLAEIGIDMRIEAVEPGVFSERRNSGSYDALARIWNPVYDPDQAALFAAGNFSGYDNPEVTELANAGLKTSDQEERTQIYAELQRLLSVELPHLFLYSEYELHAIDTSVTGLAAHPVNVFWNLPTWTIE